MRWYKKDGRCWAGNGGRGKGRSWSCAVCVHEQGQGWVSSLPALLLAASFCIKPLTCCSSAGWAWARGKRAARVRKETAETRPRHQHTNTHDGTCTHAYTHIMVCCCYDKSANTHHQPKKQTTESQQRQQTATTASAARGYCVGSPLWWPLVVNVKCILPIPDPQTSRCVRAVSVLEATSIMSPPPRDHLLAHLHLRAPCQCTCCPPTTWGPELDSRRAENSATQHGTSLTPTPDPRRHHLSDSTSIHTYAHSPARAHIHNIRRRRLMLSSQGRSRQVTAGPTV